MEAAAVLNPVIVEAADVTHPVAIDLRIEPRRHARQPRALRPFGFGLEPRRGVAAFLAERADGVHRLGVVPRARFEAVIPSRDCADRTHIHQVSGEQRVHALLLEGRNLAPVAAIDDVDLGVGIDLLHEPDAARAENTAVAVEHQRRAEIHVGFDAFAIEHPPREAHPAFVRAKAIGEILEGTLTAFVTHRAVERVIDEQKLEDTRARVDHIRGLRMDHHAVGDRRRARRLQLRHLLDFHDADPAGSVDSEARMVAVVGNPDAGLDGRLQDCLALLGRDSPTVNRQRNGVHKPLILY